MLPTTLAGLRGHGRRLISAGVAILIGVAFIATTLVVAATMKAGVEHAVAADVGQRAVVVTSGDTTIDAATVERVRAVEGTGEVREKRQVFATLGSGNYAMALSAPAAGNATELTAGRLPQAPGEVTVSTVLAGSQELSVGESLTFSTPEPAAQSATVTVVGVADTTGDPMLGATSVLFALNTDLAGWEPDGGIRQLQVDGAPGHPDEQLRDAVAAALGDGLVVRTGAQEATATVAMLTGGSDVLTSVLLGFGAVSLVVSAIVIANTFTIVLAQRTRELALLRTIGATRGQVLRSVLLEALVLAAVASAVGLLAGLALSSALGSWAGSADLGVPMDRLTVTVTSMAVPFVLGLVVTMTAALLPARRATRVAPLEALRPVTGVRARSRAGALRLVLAVLALTVGVAALLLGARDHQLVIGVSGGILSFLGVLLASTVLVPAAVAALGAIPSRVAGVPGRLAVDNAVRNPSRAAATSAALLVGVTLITMMSVGAASTQRTVDAEIAQEYPVDAALLADTHLPESVTRAAAAVEGVSDSMVLPGAPVSVQASGGPASEHRVLAVDPAAAQRVLRSAVGVSALSDGVLLVESTRARGMGLADGQEVTVSSGQRSVPMTARLTDSGPHIAVTPDDLERLAPAAPVAGLWLRLVEGADLGSVMQELAATTAGADGVTITGAAPERVELQEILDTMLLVVTALLGVAVLIALIGIANTLSLSVLERSRESALLRALGLTRAQLRGMLAVEAMLLAAVSAGLGVLLGTFYGLMGIQTALPEGTSATLVLPWGRLALVMVVALVAGLAASVLPARRAARVAPAAALAAG